MYDLTDALIVMNHALDYGSALLSGRSFQAGDVIARFDDAPVAEQSYLTVQVGLDQHVKLDLLSHLNHSCDPNTILDTTARTVIAARDIDAGEVLNYFYPSTEWEMDRPFVCQCGASDCLKVVAGARHLSPASLSRSHVNLHIIRAINALLQSPSQRRLARTRTVRSVSAPAPAPDSSDKLDQGLPFGVGSPMAMAA